MRKRLFLVLAGFTILMFSMVSCAKDCTKTSTELSCAEHCGYTGNTVYVYNKITNKCCCD